MNDQLRIGTDRFRHEEVKSHFINPCCFGEDFAHWLIDRLASLKARGFEISDPIQEDYGWGFWIQRDGVSFWVALSYVGTGPTADPAEWVVSVNYDGGLNVLKRLFHKRKSTAFNEIRDVVWATIKSTSGFQVLSNT